MHEPKTLSIYSSITECPLVVLVYGRYLTLNLGGPFLTADEYGDTAGTDSSNDDMSAQYLLAATTNAMKAGAETSTMLAIMYCTSSLKAGKRLV